jgi:crossover junction endodeoxyribonuclease RuvC
MTPPQLTPVPRDLDGEVIVLGVDPGLRITGYGVLRCSPSRIELVEFNHIKTDPRAPVEARLHAVHWGIRESLLRVGAQEMAIELPFVAANVRSAFAIGEARAAALLAAAEENVPVFQYTPAEVKQSIAGYGRSDKPQMQEAIRLQLGLATVPEPADAADALAIALCHYANRRLRALTAMQK